MRLLPAIAAFLLMAAPAQAQQRLTVLLDWFINPDHAPLIVAEARGYFAEEGLAVTLVAPADPSAPPRLVAAGEGDIAITYQPNLYLQVAEDLGLVRVGTLVATPLNTLVALADGPVQSIADLEGRTIGFSVAGFEDALLGEMLESAGLSLSDVRLVNVNFALSPALLAGQVDAVIGAFRNFELTQLELEGSRGLAFYPEEHGVPPYDELIYVTRRDVATDDRIPAFLRAVEKGTLYLLNHPDDALALFLEAHPDLDDALNRRAFADTLPRFSQSPAAFDRARYRRFAEFMAEKGLIPEARPLEDYAVAIE